MIMLWQFIFLLLINHLIGPAHAHLGTMYFYQSVTLVAHFSSMPASKISELPGAKMQQN